MQARVYPLADFAAVLFIVTFTSVDADMDMGQLFETQPNPPKYKPNPTQPTTCCTPTQPISIYP